ncbi:hypothetical protein NLX83_09800 [Allokutzneria sp. A3M-2-11 16]|uniref:hypothetical protein n=1 Tax=Allokutzneria sp. A3M-2-11 16 TaxID=2962043 RepID=UPI0020B726D5|nr:hypothetical protein [Allokutzneria sp. A3M-2-11 16]MCP3799548.1 hypothetical protein [Allokutzneria sp. A3M-2-11 16]
MAVRLDPVRGALRALRGCLLATTSAALATLGHALAGGSVPDTALTVLLTVLIATVAISFADRRRGPLAILATLGTAQLTTHLLLSALTLHDHGAVTDTWAMFAAHAAATLATALLLGGAESAIFGMAAALGAVLPRRCPRPPVFAPLLAVLPARSGLITSLDVLLRRAHARRGPPLTS